MENKIKLTIIIPTYNQKEYDSMVANYRKARKKAQEKGQDTSESLIYTNLTNYLFEKLK